MSVHLWTFEHIVINARDPINRAYFKNPMSSSPTEIHPAMSTTWCLLQGNKSVYCQSSAEAIAMFHDRSPTL